MKRTIVLSLFLAAIIGFLTGPARADSIVYGGTLLTQSSANQLASWLGEGDLALTEIYSGSPGTPTAFHAAADGKGRTFSVAQVQVGSGPAQLVGGYDPVSWSSSNVWNVNYTNAGRTAFIFNLSTSLLLRQQLDNIIGSYQTWNGSDSGPQFGDAIWLLYGSYAGGGVPGAPWGYGSSTDVFGGTGGSNFSISQLEVYTIADVTPVPEPSTGALTVTMLIGIGTVLWWRRSQHS